MSNDEPSELRKEEDAARERLRETEAEAEELLEEAEQIDDVEVPEKPDAE
jgi:hypothetical protein